MDSLEPYTIPFEDIQVLCKIGSTGSAAVIHKALWKTKENLHVAIKIYTKSPYRKEIEILRKLDHPNIIKFYGIVDIPLASGIVIEFASGGDLFTFLSTKRKSKTKLSPRQFTNWALDTAVAIQYLHKRHITHKDVKSLNVLISDDVVNEEGEEPLNILKICDFGISKETTNTESVMSSYGGFSKPWASPEVIKDHRVVSQKSDIYSLCIVFWELWTCEEPWSEELSYDIEVRVKQGISLKLPSDFPEILTPMMKKCWQVERSRRCDIDDIIVCIKRLMSEWHIKDYREGLSENGECIEREITSGEKVEPGKGDDNNEQPSMQVDEINNKPELPVIQEEQVVKQEELEKNERGSELVETQPRQPLNIGEKSKDIVEEVEPQPKELLNIGEKSNDGMKDVEELQTQQSLNKEEKSKNGVKEVVEHKSLNIGKHGNDDMKEVQIQPENSLNQKCEESPKSHSINNIQEAKDIPDTNLSGGTDINVSDKIDSEDGKLPGDECDGPAKEGDNEVTDKTYSSVHSESKSFDTDFVKEGRVSYIVSKFESFDALDDDEKIKEVINTGKICTDQNQFKKSEDGKYPRKTSTSYAVFNNVISPVPKIVDYYDDVEATFEQQEGRTGQELLKLYNHVEESYKDLELVKEEFIVQGRLHRILNEGERRHLMINTVDVEDIMSRFNTWFKKCKWQVPAVCELVLNILEADYLQPIINFAIYSHLQMNMLKFIRHRCLDFPEKLTKKQRPGCEEADYKLSFADLQSILLKQANWLKKFLSILKSLYDALVAEKVEDESVIQDLKECCSKLEVIIKNCSEHETRIIQDIHDHSTSLLHKLRFDPVNNLQTITQKSMISEESWVKKSGTIYVIDDAKQTKRHSKAVEHKKYTMIAFVSTVLIVENKGEYFKVVDCLCKKSLKFQTQEYMNIGGSGSEVVLLSKLNPHTKACIKEYVLTFENSNDIQEWSKVLKFSEEDKLSQDMEYITPLEILNTTCTEPTYENCHQRPTFARSRSIYENIEAIQVLSSIIALNKKTTESLSKLRELYIDNIILSGIIGEGEKHHLYLNILEVNNVIESFNNRLEINQYDSFHFFTELRKHLEEDAFHPIIEYEAHMVFQRNMLQFQRKHNTAFYQVLGNLERDAQAKWRVSEMDLQLRLSKPADWLARLFHKLKTLEGVMKSDPDHQESFHRLNAETLHMLHQLIEREQDLRKTIEQDAHKHVTSVLLNLPMPTVVEPHLIQKLSNIKEKWVTKHGLLTLFTKRKLDRALKTVKKRYHSSQVDVYACTSVIILSSSKLALNENTKPGVYCKCYDRNYIDLVTIDVNSRESWMPDRENLFKLLVYEKEDSDYNQIEYVLGLNSDRTITDLEEWNSALVVATGESGIFDDYTRPKHIVSESFTTDRPDELPLDVNDFVEILEMQYAMDKAWVKGKRLSDGRIGWFPRIILGHEIDSEYSRGQAVKQRFRKELE